VAVTDVVVIGGGIAGLAAADRLAGAGVDVTLLEPADRLGGKVCTTLFAGRPLDMGAEGLVTRDPTVIDLCHELSLERDLVPPACSPAFVWTRRGLRPLPADAVARLPGRFLELLRSRLLSPLGVLRCGWDLIAPSRAPESDVAIGAIVRSRLGREVLEQLVDPLLGGIHAGRCDTLSARALAPQFIGAMATGKGLARGLRAAGPTAAGPAFATLRGGLESLTEALATRARDAGASVRLGTGATAVKTPGSGRVIVEQSDGDALEAAACVLATPARTTARMLTTAAPAAAAELHEIVHAPAAVVALAYPSEALAGLPAGTGFVTAGDDRLVRACTWSSAKWEHLRGDPAIVKAFVGRAGAPVPAVGDRELAAAVHRELVPALRLRRAPVELRVKRFGAAIPQYFVGHLERVERIEAALPQHVAVSGASYRGAGLGACVRSGLGAADHVLRHLGASAEAAIDETSSIRP
jgi:protoporphyrinogen/coproporphyrinogen III oxidase